MIDLLSLLALLAGSSFLLMNQVNARRNNGQRQGEEDAVEADDEGEGVAVHVLTIRQNGDDDNMRFMERQTNAAGLAVFVDLPTPMELISMVVAFKILWIFKFILIQDQTSEAWIAFDARFRTLLRELNRWGHENNFDWSRFGTPWGLVMFFGCMNRFLAEKREKYINRQGVTKAEIRKLFTLFAQDHLNNRFDHYLDQEFKDWLKATTALPGCPIQWFEQNDRIMNAFLSGGGVMSFQIRYNEWDRDIYEYSYGDAYSYEGGRYGRGGVFAGENDGTNA